MPTNLTIVNGAAGSQALDAILAGGSVTFADGNATDAVSNGEIGALSGAILLQANTTISVSGDAPVTLSAGATSLRLETKTGDITILAAITATSLSLAAGTTAGSGGKLVVAGSINTTGKLALQSDAGFQLTSSGPLAAATLDIAVATSGGVSESFSGKIIAGLLQSSGGVVGTASFAAGTNTIAAIGSFAVTGGNFVLADTGGLSVTGPLTANNVTISSATISVSGSIGAVTTLALTAGSGGVALNSGAVLSAATVDISASGGGGTEVAGGKIVGGLLRSNAGVTGSVTLAGNANTIATVGSFAVTSGDFTLSNSGSLAVTGPLTAANVRLSSATIAASASIGAATNLTLASGAGGIALNLGAILTAATVDISATGGGGTEAAAGKIVASLLQSSSGVTGSVTLAGSANTIATVGSFAVSSGDFSLTDTGNLAVTGRVTAANVRLSGTAISVSGSIGAAADVTLTPGGSGLSIGATGIISLGGAAVFDASTTVNNGTIQANGGSLSFTGGGLLTGTGAIRLGLSASATFNAAVAASQSVTFLTNSGTLALGAPAGFGATVFGMVAGDVIDLTGVAPTGVLAVGLGAGNVLSITKDGAVIGSVQLDQAQNFAGNFFHAAADGAGTGVIVTENNIPCFLAGTRIRTPGGAVAVEGLRVGDQVQTLSGEARPIVWIGSGRTLVSPRNRCDVSPVIVRAGALGRQVPARDVTITRHHAVLVDQILVPVEHLINGVSILWDESRRVIEYFHIELETHDILLAEGAPFESFRDDGDVSQFQNLATRPVRGRQSPCRSVIRSGPALEVAWRKIAARAGRAAPSGFTREADLHLVVDNVRISGTSRDGATHVFGVPAGANMLEIVSNTYIPAIDGVHDDRRRLGVAIREIIAWRHNAGWVMPLAGCDDGWHGMGDGHRWTKGRARVRPLWDGAYRLEIVTVPALGCRRPLKAA